MTFPVLKAPNSVAVIVVWLVGDPYCSYCCLATHCWIQHSTATAHLAAFNISIHQIQSCCIQLSLAISVALTYMCLVTHICILAAPLASSDASYYKNCPNSTQSIYAICMSNCPTSKHTNRIINCSPKRVQRSCLVSNDSLVNSSLLKI